MMQHTLFSTLAPLVSGRVFPNIAPHGAQTPYVVYARISSVPDNTLSDGAPATTARLQVDCFDTTYAAAITLAESVKAALAGSALTQTLLSEQDQFEADAFLHRVILDFSIWHPR